VFSISHFEELLKPLPRGRFDALVRRHESDRHCKGFGTRDQLLVMLSGQWNDCKGLRQTVEHFNLQKNIHHHLGTDEVGKSTLADANAKRSPEVFADVARSLMSEVQGGQRRGCGKVLQLLDSTSITLKGREFDRWTLHNRTRHTQGLKLHLVFDAKTQAPVWHSITAPNVNDRDEGVKVPLHNGVTYVFDKGYCDYNWWHEIDRQKAKFVTRFKKNAALAVQRTRNVPKDARGLILCDQLVTLANRKPGGGRCNRYEKALRRIEVAREGKPPIVLATNDLRSSAVSIAEAYRDRWDIELFFKWIKQHLNVKRFLGRSERAVRTQILIALIAYLLLVLHKKATGSSKTLWEQLCESRAKLFTRSDTQNELYRRRRQAAQDFAAAQHPLFT
jgi:IS4 transposase